LIEEVGVFERGLRERGLSQECFCQQGSSVQSKKSNTTAAAERGARFRPCARDIDYLRRAGKKGKPPRVPIVERGSSGGAGTPKFLRGMREIPRI